MDDGDDDEEEEEEEEEGGRRALTYARTHARTITHVAHTCWHLVDGRNGWQQWRLRDRPGGLLRPQEAVGFQCDPRNATEKNYRKCCLIRYGRLFL